MFAKTATALSALAIFSGLVVAQVARAEDAKTHDGMVVSAADGKLVMTGSDGKEHSHAVAASVPVTVNGKPGKLDDLKKGIRIKVSTDKDGNVLAVATLDAKKR
jgi:hypothetical protein